MSQLNVSIDALPPGAKVYQGVVADAPGVVAANNFVSLFNPVSSIRTIVTLALIIQCYSSTNSTAGASMQLFRTTAASAGTLLAAANITKYDTTQPNSVAEWRTGNPTVTLLSGGLALASVAPVESTGGGTANPASISASSGTAPTLHPGEGIVFTTASGNTNQIWNIQLIWMEF